MAVLIGRWNWWMHIWTLAVCSLKNPADPTLNTFFPLLPGHMHSTNPVVGDVSSKNMYVDACVRIKHAYVSHACALNTRIATRPILDKISEMANLNQTIIIITFFINHG